MNRRRVIAGLGAVVATGAVAGTGAFSQVTSDRDADIAVTREDGALLQLAELDPVDYPNADVAKNTGSGATLELDFNQVLGTDGHGPNAHALVTFDNVFRVTNSGSQDVFFWAEFPDAPMYDEMGFYVDDSSELLDGESSAALLSPGESALIGVTIDTDRVVDDRDAETIDVTIRADESDPTTSN